MKVITKSYHTGNEIIVNVNQKTKTFKLYDYTFTLNIIEDHSNCENYPMVIYDIIHNQLGSIGKVCHDINNPDNKYHNESFEAFYGEISENSFSTTGNNIYNATIKMLSNII